MDTTARTPALQTLALGFADPVADAQQVFRLALQALAQPGTPLVCPPTLPPVPGLMPATAALLLALADHETPVWWSRPEAAAWLRFHTGAPTTARPEAAAFAVLCLGDAAPALAAFGAGSDDAPERSTTLLIELPSLVAGACTQWSGPGLRVPRSVQPAGLPAGFWAQWRGNRARFPSGVDLLLTCGQQLMGLPRTTAVVEQGTL